MTRSNSVQSVTRALRIVEAIAARGGSATLSDIADEVGLPAATAHRLLRTMAEQGFIVQHINRRYCLGGKFAPIGEVAAHMP